MSSFSEKSKRFIRRHPKNDAPINILKGTVRSSKTWTMIPKVLFGLNNYDIPGDKIIFGVSKDSIYHNVLNDLFNFAGTKNYDYNRQSGELWLLNTKWNVVGAKDEGSEKYIRGRTVGIAYGDELVLTPKSFFEMMLSRMSPDGSRLYGTTNPDSPYHWLYTDYLTNEKLIESNTIWSEDYFLSDNLSLSKAKIAYYNSIFKGVFHQRMILGKWVIAEGAIYKDCYSDDLLYNDSTRPISLLNAGGHVQMFVPIDYGTGNPTVFLLVIDDGETYWVEREYYYDSNEVGVQKTDGQYADDLEYFLATYCPDAQCIIDPSAASFKTELTQRGVWHCDANNDVIDGIRTVSSLMARKKVRIHERCDKLRVELQTYAWDTKAQKKGEDKPIKKKDHAPDAFRYFAHTKVPSWRITA